MKNFFTKLGASLSSVEYYRLVLYQSFWPVFRFYLGFLVLLSLAMTGYYWISLFPQYQTTLNKNIAEVSTHYPPDLLIQWNGTQLSTSTTPLTLPLPSFIYQEIKDEKPYLAIVTATESAVPDVNTFFLITPTQIHTVDEDTLSEGVQLSDLLGAQPQVVTKDTLPTYLQKIQEFMTMMLHLVGYVFPLVAFIFLLVSSLYILLIETAIIFLLLKLQRSTLSFRQLFQLNMNLFIPAQIISFVTTVSGVDVPISMLSLSFWILFIFVYFSLQKKIAK